MFGDQSALRRVPISKRLGASVYSELFIFCLNFWLFPPWVKIRHVLGWAQFEIRRPFFQEAKDPLVSVFLAAAPMETSGVNKVYGLRVFLCKSMPQKSFAERN